MPPLCLVPYYAYRPLAALGVSDGFRLFRFFWVAGFGRSPAVSCRLPGLGFLFILMGGGKAGGLEVMGLSFSSACFRALCFVLCVARCLSRAAVADSGLGIFSRLP